MRYTGKDVQNYRINRKIKYEKHERQFYTVKVEHTIRNIKVLFFSTFSQCEQMHSELNYILHILLVQKNW